MTAPEIINKVTPASSTAESPTVAQYPFDDDTADIILSSSDDVHFRFHKILLSCASPFFTSMFRLPQPSDQGSRQDGHGEVPVIRVAEPSDTLKALLQFCHPGCVAEVKSLSKLQDILAAAIKYDMDGVVERLRMREMLRVACVTEDDAVRAYAIACRFKFEEEARLAARHSLTIPLWERPLVVELDFISASALHRLHRYTISCNYAAKSVADEFGWITQPTAFVFISGCTSCNMKSEQITISGTVCEVQVWWLEYMRAVSLALSQRPQGSTVSQPYLLDPALKKGINCSVCRSRVLKDMRTFCKKFEAEVERAVSEVDLELKF